MMAILHAYLFLILLLPWCGSVKPEPETAPIAWPVVVERHEVVLIALRYQTEIRSLLTSLPILSDFGAASTASEPAVPILPDEPCPTDRTSARRLSVLMSFRT